jgi:hypothetical protein
MRLNKLKNNKYQRNLKNYPEQDLSLNKIYRSSTVDTQKVFSPLTRALQSILEKLLNQ